jgi:endogenous inhibitor of DNA gyrase (YacG/DUF329 family)
MTTTTAFGDPTYSDTPAHDATGPDPSSTPTQSIDPNDPRLTSEVLTDNAAADAYATPLPLPDGKWRAKAKQVDIKDDKKQLQRYAVFQRPGIENNKPFFATNIEFSIIDHSGAHDGVKLTEYWIKTLVDGRKGTSQSDTMVRKLGGKTLPSSTDKQRIDLLLATLATEPELIVETAWSAECQTCQESAKKKGDKAPRPFLAGMHRFPSTRTPGVHDPIVPCPVCKAQVRAQPRIVGFYSLAESKATHGTGTAR